MSAKLGTVASKLMPSPLSRGASRAFILLSFHHTYQEKAEQRASHMIGPGGRLQADSNMQREGRTISESRF